MKEEFINSAAQAYCGAAYGTLETNQVAYDAFKEGAKFICAELKKSLWHDAKSEIPEANKFVLLGWKDFPGLCLEKYPKMNKKIWESEVFECMLDRYLYPEDLEKNLELE